SAETHFPALYDSNYVTNKIYAEPMCSTKVKRLAQRLTTSSKIKQRAIAIDLDHYPQKRVTVDNQPVKWGEQLGYKLLKKLSAQHVDFISVSYNTSSHQNFVPNLACQIGQSLTIQPSKAPQEIVNYGCASGIFSIESAFQHCQQQGSA